MQLLRVVSVVLVILCECSVEIRSDLMSLFTRDYLVGLNLTERWSEGNIPDLVLDQILDLYAPVSPAVDNELCRNHSLEYKQAIKDKHLWAWFMLEASAIVPEGLLTGNTVQLGNYEGCLEMTNIRTTSGSFSGQHCMVTLNEVDNPVEYSSNESATVESPEDTLILDGLLFSPHLKWSVCIPSSCTPRDLETHLRSTLQGLIRDLTVTVEDNACRSREQPTVLTAGDWFAIVFLAVFAIIVVLSTAYDLKYCESDSRSPLLASFSIYTNGRKLLTPSKGGDTLQAVNGIRTLSMMSIVIGHIYEQALFDLPSINLEQIQSFHYDLAHVGVTNYRLAVDTFFVLSGLLVSYIFLRGKEKGKAFNVPLYYLHRYIRLTPAYAAMILLTATLLGQAGDGPLWEDTMKPHYENCINNWWINLIYMNNYIRPLETCLEQSWYLSADMHLYLLSPLILIPLWRWQRHWKAIVGGTILAGLVVNFLVSFNYSLGVLRDADELNVLWYLPTHMRFVPWLIGIGLGYVLHKAKTTPLTLSRPQVGVGWLLCAVFLVGPMFVNEKFENDEDISIFFNSLYLAVNKPVFSLGVAWVILACSQGYGGPLNTFLSWSVFDVLSRLTYTVYLLHLYFVSANAGTLRNAPYISDRILLMQFVSVVTVSFFAAMLLSLVFEAPALIIEKLLLGDGEPRQRNTRKYNVEKLNPGDAPEGFTLVNILDDSDNKRAG